MTKFKIKYELKTPTTTPYEMKTIGVEIESDTELEPMQNTFDRAVTFVESQVMLTRQPNGEVNNHD
jgi:hypothetical protein